MQIWKGSEYLRIMSMSGFCICKRCARFCICQNMAEQSLQMLQKLEKLENSLYFENALEKLEYNMSQKVFFYDFQKTFFRYFLQILKFGPETFGQAVILS